MAEASEGIRDMSSLNDIEQALIDAQDYFHNRADVNDVDYGVPDPNREMVLDNQMSEALSQIDDLRQTLARRPTPDAGAMPEQRVSGEKLDRILEDGIHYGDLSQAMARDLRDLRAYVAGKDCEPSDELDYSDAVGKAGEQYLRSFGLKADGSRFMTDPNQALPATFRWHELFARMTRVARKETGR